MREPREEGVAIVARQVGGRAREAVAVLGRGGFGSGRAAGRGRGGEAGRRRTEEGGVALGDAGPEAASRGERHVLEPVEAGGANSPALEAHRVRGAEVGVGRGRDRRQSRGVETGPAAHSTEALRAQRRARRHQRALRLARKVAGLERQGQLAQPAAQLGDSAVLQLLVERLDDRARGRHAHRVERVHQLAHLGRQLGPRVPDPATLANRALDPGPHLLQAGSVLGRQGRGRHVAELGPLNVRLRQAHALHAAASVVEGCERGADRVEPLAVRVRRRVRYRLERGAQVLVDRRALQEVALHQPQQRRRRPVGKAVGDASARHLTAAAEAAPAAPHAPAPRAPTTATATAAAITTSAAAAAAVAAAVAALGRLGSSPELGRELGHEGELLDVSLLDGLHEVVEQRGRGERRKCEDPVVVYLGLARRLEAFGIQVDAGDVLVSSTVTGSIGPDSFRHGFSFVADAEALIAWNAHELVEEVGLPAPVLTDGRDHCHRPFDPAEPVESFRLQFQAVPFRVGQ